MKNVRELVLSAAAGLASGFQSHPVLVGFDGFVDEIIHVVKQRESADHYTRMEKMAEFGQRVVDAAGLSCNIELVTQRIKLGGNGPIFANALHTLGHKLTYTGALGETAIHPVFDQFAQSCEQVVSLAEPGHTLALEFHDGKVMQGNMVSLADVTFEALLERMPASELETLVNGQRLCGFVNWTMLPYMDGIFEGFTDVFGRTPERENVFVDLADPAKRTPADIREALRLLGAMQGTADVILGLNKHESAQIAELLGIEPGDDLPARAAAIRESVEVSCVLIHPLRRSICATEEGAWEVPGPFCAEPKLTTGAGDVFNSGFCHGLLSGLSHQQSLAAGGCASGFYVRNARPATNEELVAFLRSWADCDCGEI